VRRSRDFTRIPVIAGSVNPTLKHVRAVVTVLVVYVLQQLAVDVSKRDGDPHAALRINHTPAILLCPECNYLSWAGAVDYRKTLPNLKVYYIPRAGHFIQFEQPALLDRVIEAFLLDQPDAIPAYAGDADPRVSTR
jgi:pimeloyl-ACP methyl ester carboxylesterase